jgi:hypothetical protein
MSINIPTAFIANIFLPYGRLSEVLDWCRCNCTGEWKFGEDIHTTDSWTYYNFYFENEQDYVAFLLWHK